MTLYSKSLALIGAGYWGKNLARNFHHLGVLHTVCDLDPQILAGYRDGFTGVKLTDAVDSLWGDSAITAVAIASPAVLHYRLAKKALLAGKDVYSEKPLCLDVAEAADLIELADNSRRVLMVGHLLQYHPLIEELQRIVRSGELGKLLYITSNRLNLGKIRKEENSLWSFAPHDLSVILSLTAGELPSNVRCTGGNFLRSDVADTTLTTLAFPSGIRGHVYVSWLNPFKEQKLTVVGAKAMAVFDDTRPWADKLVFYRDYLALDSAQNHVPTRAVASPVSVPEAEPLRCECMHFLDCCARRIEPRTNGREGLNVLRVLQAAQASLNSGGTPQQIRTT